MSRKTRNWHGNRNRCRIVLRDRIFGYTSLPRTRVTTFGGRAVALARPAAARLRSHGLIMGVVLGTWCPPQVGDGAGRREPTMLNGGGDTSITISGTRLSDLNSIAGRQNARRAPPALRRDPRKLRGIGAGASASSIPVQTSSSRLSSAAATFALCSSAKRWQLPWEIHVPRAGRRRPLPGRRCQRCRRI
jgi:hypothetical protein